MTVNLSRILESKQAYRQHLASRPIGEKLRMLDAMRERELVIRMSRGLLASRSSVVREEVAPYRTESE